MASGSASEASLKVPFLPSAHTPSSSPPQSPRPGFAPRVSAIPVPRSYLVPGTAFVVLVFLSIVALSTFDSSSLVLRQQFCQIAGCEWYSGSSNSSGSRSGWRHWTGNSGDSNSQTELVTEPAASDAEIDARYCPEQAKLGRACSFFFPAFITEGETRAQQSLYQAGLLAKSLGRTLVLPNVQTSRMAACGLYPFNFYYADNALADLGFPTIPQAQLLEWASLRPTAPSAHLVSMRYRAEGDAYPEGVVERVARDDHRLFPYFGHCLDKARFDWSNRSAIAILPPQENRRTRNIQARVLYNVMKGHPNAYLPDDVAADFADEDSTNQLSPDSADIIVMSWAVGWPMFKGVIGQDGDVTSTPATDSAAGATLVDDSPLPSGVLHFRNFHLSPMWHEYGSLIADTLAPYIAVHWRTETIEAEKLPGCADGFIEEVGRLLAANPDIKNVFLATDYPLERLEGLSDFRVPHILSFHNITSIHDDAFRRLLDAFKNGTFGEAVQFSTIPKFEAKMKLPAHIDEKLTWAEKVQAERNGGVMPTGGEDWSPRPAESPFRLGRLDTAVMGLIAKTILMRGEVFIVGWPGRAMIGTGGIAGTYLQPYEVNLLEMESRPDVGLRTAHDEAVVGFEKRTYCARPSTFSRNVMAERMRERITQKLGRPTQFQRTLRNDVGYFAP